MMHLLYIYIYIYCTEYIQLNSFPEPEKQKLWEIIKDELQDILKKYSLDFSKEQMKVKKRMCDLSDDGVILLFTFMKKHIIVQSTVLLV